MIHPENSTPVRSQDLVPEHHYPVYYRKKGSCVKRESPTTGIRIEVPDPGKLLPTIHSPVVTADGKRFDEMVKDYQVCDEEIYMNYLGTYFSANREKERILNARRQHDYETGKLRL